VGLRISAKVGTEGDIARLPQSKELLKTTAMPKLLFDRIQARIRPLCTRLNDSFLIGPFPVL
jgi:hypothetical protein